MLVSADADSSGLWGFQVLLTASREATDPKGGDLIQHVVVSTELISCDGKTKTASFFFGRDLTEDFGDGSSATDQIEFLGVGPKYEEKIQITVKGEWWIQEVKDGAPPKTAKADAISYPIDNNGSSAVQRATYVKEGTQPITVPNILDASPKEDLAEAEKLGRKKGALTGAPLSKKAYYEIVYVWSKCADSPNGKATFYGRSEPAETKEK